METKTTIHLAIPTNEEYWTQMPEDVESGWVERAISAYQERLVAAIREKYPRAELFIRRVPETLSRNNQTRVSVCIGETLPDDPGPEMEMEDRIMSTIESLESRIGADIADVD